MTRRKAQQKYSPAKEAASTPAIFSPHSAFVLSAEELRTLGAQGVKFALQLGGLAILARLLKPEDFGLMAMVVAITGFVGLFSELGLAAATVQRDDVTEAQVSALFWVNLGLGVLLAAVLAVLSPLIAKFYGDSRLTAIAAVLAATFALGGAAVQHRALLLRRMRFRALAAISVASLLVGTAVSVLAAWLGAGYWSLVFGALASTAVGTAAAWTLAAWRPGPLRRGTGAGGLLRFGGNVAGCEAVGYFARRADDILLGVTWGAAPLALYSTAYRLLLLPIGQITTPLTSVALPTLSRLRTEPDRYRRYYRQAMGLLAFMGMPIVAFSLAAAPELVELVLGPQWFGSVPIFRALGPAAFVGTMNVASGWVFVSLGHVDRQLRWVLFAVPFIVGSFLMGLPWGPLGVAVACSFAMTAVWLGSVMYSFRSTFLKLSDLFSQLWQPAAASVVAGVITWSLLVTMSEDWPVPMRLGIAGGGYVSAWLLCWAILPGGWRRFRADLGQIRAALLPGRGR